MAEQQQEEQVNTALSDLAALGSALGAAAGKAKEADKVKNLILEKFETLDIDTAKALLKDERVQRLLEVLTDERAQAAGDPPGYVREGWIGNTKVQGFTKKEWTEADLRNQPNAAGKLVTFTPGETIPIFWNGLMRQFIADEEITVEACFKYIYDQHRLATKQAREHAAYLFKQRDTLSDTSMVTAEGARARGTGETGWYKPGAGSILPAAFRASEAETENPGQQKDSE